MKASIIIGAQFGDEGKGVVTDFLSSFKHNPIVVRFSGGQQAGHTVIRDGIKHIHSNYGSGTLLGVGTYLTEDTTFYLPTMFREREVLMSKGIIPSHVYVHPLARITTPYDVAYNRLFQPKDHGTCGLGVGATNKRIDYSPYKLYAIHLHNNKLFNMKVDSIIQYYQSILSAEDFITLTKLALSSKEIPLFNNLSLHYTKYIQIQGYDFLKSFDNVIFEGSQGIMLDAEHGIFPHVTYSNTTSKNAMKVCKELGLKPSMDVDLYYVTRCYETRHGNGPMTGNTLNEKLINNEEEINVENAFQGTFRTREINYELIDTALNYDDVYSYNARYKHLVVTCLDQRPGFKLNFKSDHINTILTNNSPQAGNIK